MGRTFALTRFVDRSSTPFLAWWAKGTCLCCQRPVRHTQELRSRIGTHPLVVCRLCYRTWERDGRQCPACHTSVAGPQNVGVFVKPRPSLGHVDCGGALLTW